jgi:hypothetical protein
MDLCLQGDCDFLKDGDGRRTGKCGLLGIEG